MQIDPIRQRLDQPTPQQVKQARVAAGLTQTQAALLISPSETKPYRTWQNYETEIGEDGHRAIPRGIWELFLLVTDQHPQFKLVRHKRKPAIERKGGE